MNMAETIIKAITDLICCLVILVITLNMFDFKLKITTKNNEINITNKIEDMKLARKKKGDK